MSQLLAPGEAAPDFTLQASDGRTIRLSDEVRDRRILLLFYPGNNTPG